MFLRKIGLVATLANFLFYLKLNSRGLLRIIYRYLTLRWKPKWSLIRCLSRWQLFVTYNLTICYLSILLAKIWCVFDLSYFLLQVVFWKWVTPKMLGMVTQTSVYHWSIEGTLSSLHPLACKLKTILSEIGVQSFLYRWFWTCEDVWQNG